MELWGTLKNPIQLICRGAKREWRSQLRFVIRAPRRVNKGAGFLIGPGAF
jgi:hypothetical protein